MRLSKIFIILLTGSLITATHVMPKNYILFSPEDKPVNTLIELINTSKKSIYAAVYFLTDKKVAESLINAKKRGVDVQVVTDPISTHQSFGKAGMLAQNSVTLYVFNPSGKIDKPIFQDQRFTHLPIMHHKFALFDDAILWTGSFNWTQAANDKNCENVIYTDDKETCQKYKTYWKSFITQKCSKYTVTKKLSQQNRSCRRAVKPLKKQWQTAQRVSTRRNVAKA